MSKLVTYVDPSGVVHYVASCVGGDPIPWVLTCCGRQTNMHLYDDERMATCIRCVSDNGVKVTIDAAKRAFCIEP